jgi:hypothetical protein
LLPHLGGSALSNGTELIFSQDQNVDFELPTGFRNDGGDISLLVFQNKKFAMFEEPRNGHFHIEPPSYASNAIVHHGRLDPGFHLLVKTAHGARPEPQGGGGAPLLNLIAAISLSPSCGWQLCSEQRQRCEGERTCFAVGRPRRTGTGT